MAIHPSSVLSNKKPTAIVFDELVHTTRHYARTVTVIDTNWLAELAPHFFSHPEGSHQADSLRI